VTKLTGLTADVTAAYTANGTGLTGLGNEAVMLQDASGVSVLDVNVVDAATTGVITATLSDGGMTALNGLRADGNAYTITVSDATVFAADLIALDAKTTVQISAGQVQRLIGTAQEIISLYGHTHTISGLGNEAVTVISGTTVSEANQIDQLTSGVVTATLSEGQMATLLGDNDTSLRNLGPGNEYSIKLTDETVTATDMLELDSKTTLTAKCAPVLPLVPAQETGPAGLPQVDPPCATLLTPRAPFSCAATTPTAAT
jgi:hypothetical protein